MKPAPCHYIRINIVSVTDIFLSESNLPSAELTQYIFPNAEYFLMFGCEKKNVCRKTPSVQYILAALFESHKDL